MLDLVVVIDADNLERRFVAAALASEGLNVAQVAGTIDGVLGVIDWAPRLIVLAEDVAPLRLEDALSLLRRLTTAPVVVIGDGGPPGEVESLGMGGDIYLTRPISASALLLRVRSILGRGREQAHRETRIDLNGLLPGSRMGNPDQPPYERWRGTRSA